MAIVATLVTAAEKVCVPLTEIKLAAGVTTTVAVVLLLELLLLLQPALSRQRAGKSASAVTLAHRIILSLRIIEILTVGRLTLAAARERIPLAAECLVRPHSPRTCGSP
jgi:hypothetical protein